MTQTLRDLTRGGRDLAAAHLARRGYTILARDAQTRHGALDIVAAHDDAVVFVSVATIRARQAAPPIDTQQMRRRAVDWLASSPRPRASDIRFLALTVVVDAQGRLVRLDHPEPAEGE